MTVKVSVEEVNRVAELAHLSLTAEESGRMASDLNAILNYVAHLNELDTAGVAPLAQVAELAAALAPGSASGTRADEPAASLPRQIVMAQAPESNGAFFKVPKVIER